MYIYYTSKMVTNIDELPGYDWSQFVADMGGSVGFLLGLSIIAVIVVLEKILGHLFLNKFIEEYTEKKKKRIERNENEKKDLRF
jgi:Amiloride-sensitive sodium channel